MRVWKGIAGPTLFSKTCVELHHTMKTKRKKLMATLRQKGTPTAFVTLSSIEYHWRSLLKAIYKTKIKKRQLRKD